MPNLFIWPSQAVNGTVKRRKMRAQFGDGYSQVALDGINTRVQSWPFRHTGLKPDIDLIAKFIDDNPLSFQWENPNGEVGLYECDEYNIDRVDAFTSTITATFQQVFR